MLLSCVFVVVVMCLMHRTNNNAQYPKHLWNLPSVEIWGFATCSRSCEEHVAEKNSLKKDWFVCSPPMGAGSSINRQHLSKGLTPVRKNGKQISKASISNSNRRKNSAGGNKPGKFSISRFEEHDRFVYFFFTNSPSRLFNLNWNEIIFKTILLWHSMIEFSNLY